MSDGPIKRMTGPIRQGEVGGEPGLWYMRHCGINRTPPVKCEGMAEPLWSLLPEVIVGDLDQSRIGAFRSIHAYHIMYNLEIHGLNPGSGAQIASLVQDIKLL